MWGRMPHVDELHRHTHIWRGTGEFVDERARITQEEFHRRLSQSNIPVDPAELEKLKAVLWKDTVGGPYKSRLYGTGNMYSNLLDSGASTSASLSPEHLRIIRALTAQVAQYQEHAAQQQEQLARQQQLLDHVFSHVGIPVPPPSRTTEPNIASPPTQQDQDLDGADDVDGDDIDHAYEKGY